MTEKEFSDEEMDYIFAIMNNDSSNGIPRNLIARVINDFTGKRTEAIILESLREKMVIIENDRREIKLTSEAITMIHNIAVNNWDEIPTRWRRVIYKSSQIKNISNLELNIIEELLDSSKIIVEDIVPNYRHNIGKLLALQRIGGLEFKNLQTGKTASAVRGVNFPERVAEMIYYKETHRDEISASKWREKMKEVFCYVGRFYEDLDVEKRWREKFNTAYEKAIESGVCPVGLPAGCEIAFKNDADGLTVKRRLSNKDFGIIVEVGTPFFKWIGDDNKYRKTSKPIAEIRQTMADFYANNIIITGERNILIDILNETCKEIEKIYHAIPIRKAKQTSSLSEIMDKIKIIKDQDWVSIEIPTLVVTKQEKIGIISYQKMKDILAQLQN